MTNQSIRLIELYKLQDLNPANDVTVQSLVNIICENRLEEKIKKDKENSMIRYDLEITRIKWKY